MYSTSTTTYHSALTTEDSNPSSSLGFDPNSSWTPEAIPQLTIDMYHKGDYVVVVSTVAGVTASDLDISVDNNVLYIKGVRRKPYNDAEVHAEINECFWGEFYREIALQDTANTDKIEAGLSNGILTIKIPVIRSRAKKIQINVN
jgi:HSP20 family protein